MTTTWKRNTNGRLMSENKENIETNICCNEGNSVYYKYELFNNKCSKCHLKTLSGAERIEFLEKYNPTHWKYLTYPDEMLHWYTTDLQMSDNHGFIKLFTKMIHSLNDLFNDSKHIVNILNLLYICNYNFKGLTARQAANIFNDWKTKHETVYNTLGVSACIQHLLCGLVIDWWNITSEQHGGIGYCYYSNWGKKPLLFNNNKNQKVITKPVFTYINSNIKSEKETFNMWIKMVKKIQTIPVNL